MSEKFQEKYETEQEARTNAALNHPQTTVVIIQSQGMFYLEDTVSDGMLRTWEREVYRGLGRNAKKGK